MKRLHPSRRRRAAGFTLVELMVALALSALLAGGLVVMQAVVGQHTARTRDVASRDDQVRSAMDQIAQDLAGAGFLFGGNHLPCNVLLTARNSEVSVRHQADALALSAGTAPGFAPALVMSYPPAGFPSDVLVVNGSVDTSRFSDSAAPIVRAAPSSTTSPMTNGELPVVGTVGLTQGHSAIVQVHAGGRTACLRVPLTVVTSSVSVTSSGSLMPSGGYIGFANALTAADFAGSPTNAQLFLGRLMDIGTAATAAQTATVYYIDSPAGGFPTLMRAVYSLADDSAIGTPQAVAAGVVALQVRYGIDPGNTGTVTQYATAATLTANRTWDAVRSVRVLLVGRPLIEDPDPNYQWPASPNIGLAAPFTDFVLPTSPVDMRKRRYTVQQAEFAVRNLLWR